VKRWLITTSSDEDLDQLRKDVQACGGEVDESPPVPLEGREQVVGAEGPDDLPAKLKKHPAVRKVSPDSEIEFYSEDEDEVAETAS
jgi:hypothetical protein